MPIPKPPESDLADFARLLVPGVARAATLARSLEGRVRNVPKSEEDGAVKQALTEADTGAQEAILECLIEHFPNVCLAAEEDTPLVERFPAKSPALVIIDPIDGTLRSYLEARGPYAVIVGLALSRVMQASLVALPREGLLFAGQVGGYAECTRAGGEARAARSSADGDRVLVSHAMPQRVVAALIAEGLQVVPACGGAIAVAPLIPGVRAGLRYAPGKRKRGISIRGRVGTVIAREAGAYLAADAGGEFPDDLDTPTRTLRIAADRADLAVLDRCLAAANL